MRGRGRRREAPRSRTDPVLTTVSRTLRYPGSAQGIDVRCSAALVGDVDGRCQLFAGHDGPHAVMFARGYERFVRTWRGNGSCVTADDSRPAGSSTLQRPWMFGYPMPAWFEDELTEDSAAELSG